MFSTFTDPIKITVSIVLGMAVAILLMLVTYEGISLPLIGRVINGRVAKAVETATKGMVTQVELDAANALLAEKERQRNAAALALEEYRKRLKAAEQLDKQQSEQREQEILQYEVRLSQANRQCLLDRDDLDFLRRD
jgi:DNA anti-recombination protein RmuC